MEIKRNKLLRLTIKRLVKDKIIYKKKDMYYIFGCKFNSFAEIYKKIIYYMICVKILKIAGLLKIWAVGLYFIIKILLKMMKI
jgi:hypothetical protein